MRVYLASPELAIATNDSSLIRKRPYDGHLI